MPNIELLRKLVIEAQGQLDYQMDGSPTFWEIKEMLELTVQIEVAKLLIKHYENST